MRNKLPSILLGIALIAGGGLFLASNLGMLPDLNNNPNFWIPFLAGLSVLSFICFAISGVKEWGWLFPACISAGLAATIYLGESGADDAFVAFPLLGSVALPFLLGFLFDRSRRGLLIPAWAIGSVAGLTLFADRVQEELVPLYVLGAIAIPFWFVAFTNRKAIWAMIPAGVLTMIAFIPLMTTIFSEDMIGALVMVMIALPFIVTAIYSRKNWWAQIPAGIFLSIAAVVMLVAGNETLDRNEALGTGILFLGFALTFGLLWLQRHTNPTDWARYPAIGLALCAVVALSLGAEALGTIWPVVIIAGGLLLVYRSFRSQNSNL